MGKIYLMFFVPGILTCCFVRVKRIFRVISNSFLMDVACLAHSPCVRTYTINSLRLSSFAAQLFDSKLFRSGLDAGAPAARSPGGEASRVSQGAPVFFLATRLSLSLGRRVHRNKGYRALSSYFLHTVRFRSVGLLLI